MSYHMDINMLGFGDPELQFSRVEDAGMRVKMMASCLQFADPSLEEPEQIISALVAEVATKEWKFVTGNASARYRSAFCHLDGDTILTITEEQYRSNVVTREWYS